MEKFRTTDYSVSQLAEWDLNAILELGLKNGKERWALEGLDPKLWAPHGLGRTPFS